MGVPEGGEGVGPICYSVLFLYLLCISCPMDLRCPIKAVTKKNLISIINTSCFSE